MNTAQATSALESAGRQRGFEVETEYRVEGGRLDVVWFSKTEGLPGAGDRLPVVAFEVESSSRDRKHVKGDLVNFQVLAPALGVVVVLGDGSDADSLAAFTERLADRHQPRIVVWRDDDVLRL